MIPAASNRYKVWILKSNTVNLPAIKLYTWSACYNIFLFFVLALATEISDENAFSNSTSRWVDNLDRGIKLCEALPHLESINPGQSAQVSEVSPKKYL
jgi:hypothetical protein